MVLAPLCSLCFLNHGAKVGSFCGKNKEKIELFAHTVVFLTLIKVFKLNMKQ